MKEAKTAESVEFLYLNKKELEQILSNSQVRTWT